MWLLFVLMAVMAAAVTLALTARRGDKRMSALLTGIIPSLGLMLYLLLGNPDLPATAAPSREELAPRHVMLLMQRPMEVLEKNPDDMGALATMGALSGRMRQYDKAAAFYDRAHKQALREKDPRAPMYAEDRAKMHALAAGGR